MNKCTLKYLLLLFAVNNSFSAISQLQPVGVWRDHLPYHSASHVIRAHDIIYAATPYSIFSIDPSDRSTRRFSRVNGLAQTGVAAIDYNDAVKKLIVVYNNSDIDMIHEGLVRNIPDLMLDNLTGDKSVYHAISFDKDFYLSTGIGIVVVNGERNEIKSTWIIGNGGNKIRVNAVAQHNGSLFAATIEGLKKVSLSADPADHSNWATLSGSNGLPAGQTRNVVARNDTLFALIHDSLFYSAGTSWSLLYTETGWRIRNIRSQDHGLMLFMQSSNSAKVIIINSIGQVVTSITDPNVVGIPEDGIAGAGIWIADSLKGITSIINGVHTNYDLNSPYSIATGDIIAKNEQITAASGGFNQVWQSLNNPNGFYSYINGSWTNINRENGAPAGIFNVHALAMGKDGTTWAGTIGNGLFSFRNNTFDVFAAGSAISQSVSYPGSYWVTGLAIDADEHLWITNHGSSTPIVLRKNDNTWKQIAVPFALPGNAVSRIAIDRSGRKWIASPGNGLIVYDHNKTLDDLTDDRWRMLKTGAGSGNLPSPDIRSIAVDKQGFVWVGTDNGIAVVECIQDVFNNTCEATLPVVSGGGVNNYLFRGERVHAIAVDGANRKWVGTDNGAWLISDNGDRTIHHFTRSNSVLLNDTVRSIGIDGSTGEVFFGTNSGLISYRSTATEAAGKNDVLVFPNPVPPGYTGSIAIKGLVENSIVKIMDPDGRLVFQTRALGGQAIWDGRNYKGNRISTGIYIVLVTDEQRKEKATAKIIFIHTQKP